VLAHPDNAERLASEGHSDVSTFIPAYLIPGAPPTRGARARRWARRSAGSTDAGGLAFWAHPFWDIATDAEVLEALDRYDAAELDGVECFYVAHDEHQTVLLADRAAQLGLLRSASSDFHGSHHRLFSRFLAYQLHDRTPELGNALERRVKCEPTDDRWWTAPFAASARPRLGSSP